MKWVPLFGYENGESSGDGGAAFYSFMGLIKNVRADVKNNSVIPMRVPVVQHGIRRWRQ